MNRSNKLIITILLGVMILFLVFSLVREIREPISYENESNKRKSAVIERIELIKKCQVMHREAHGKYSKTFDSLILAVKNDSIPVVSEITFKKRDRSKLADLGDWANEKVENPNDSSEYLVKVIHPKSIRDSLFKENVKGIDQIRYIPYTENDQFKLDAGMLSVQNGRYTVPVFEVKATVKQYLHGLSKKYTATEKDLILGSMTQPKITGNWK